MQNINISALLIAGIIFGLSNGLTPGPTLALVISQTLQHNLKAGLKVASAPIIFGLVIIPLSVFISIKASHFNTRLLGIISIFGALYIAYLGFKQLFFKKINLNIASNKLRSFRVGVLANFSSPYAYIFWFTVGVPLIIRAENHSALNAILFALVYYFCLIGSKIVVALITEKFRSFIEKGYSYVMRTLGIILLIFAIFILKDGIAFLIHPPL